MGSLSENGLVSQPFDQYWDAPLTRREAQQAINKLARNDTALNAMCDTLAIIGNYLCEKQGVTRAELDAYVQQKKLEVATWNEAQQLIQEEAIEAKKKEAEANA